MLLDFEMALSVAKVANSEKTGIMSLTEFLFRPKENEKNMSYNLACALARGDELMRNTLYQTIERNLRIIQCEKAYMKG